MKKAFDPQIDLSPEERIQRFKAIGETLVENGEEIALDQQLTPKEKGEKFLDALSKKDSSLAQSLAPTVIGSTLEVVFSENPPDHLISKFQNCLKTHSAATSGYTFLAFYEEVLNTYQAVVKVGDQEAKEKAQDILTKEQATSFPLVNAHLLDEKNPPIDIPFRRI